MMKKYQVRITKYAQQQMKDIAKYIKIELKNPDAAKKLMYDLMQAILSLSNLPQRISLVEEIPWYDAGIRKISIKNYLIYFWIDEEKNYVHITAVVYSKREQKRQLTQMKME